MRHDPDTDFDFLIETEKTALIIDGVSTHSAARYLDLVIDFKRMRKFFQERTQLVKACYFTPMDVHDESGIVDLADWLSINGFNCTLVNYNSAEERTRKNIDISLVSTCLQIAPNVDHIILFTAAGKYVPMVKVLDGWAKKVTLCSTVQSEVKMVSRDLRRSCDNFLDLGDIREFIERKED